MKGIVPPVGTMLSAINLVTCNLIPLPDSICCETSPYLNESGVNFILFTARNAARVDVVIKRK